MIIYAEKYFLRFKRFATIDLSILYKNNMVEVLCIFVMRTDKQDIKNVIINLQCTAFLIHQ